MSPEVLNLISQLGVAGLMFWLLMDERKARLALEEKIAKWLGDELDATRPKRPDSP